MSRFLWPAAALAATAFLLALALTGGRGSGLAPFTPNGLMTMRLEEVREVDIETSQRRWHFVRAQDGWRATEGAPAAGFETRLDAALTLLHNSGPERVLSETEVRGVDAAQFGLNPPWLRVAVNGRGAPNFTISFGRTNVLGLSHYSRRDGSGEIALLPGFVAEAWEQVGQTP